jgi:hypothetical protein
LSRTLYKERIYSVLPALHRYERSKNGVLGNLPSTQNAEAEVLGAPGAAEPIEAAGESGATGSKGSLPRHRTLKEGWQEFGLPHARAAMRSKVQRRTSRL